jgi:alkylation response protein AidB-like acyl-CoA dehydrogenase
LIDATVADAGSHGGPAIASALEEFAVEASIAKVLGSEVLDYVLDENVQIHGGNGFVKDYPAERFYRDARVNRIFEGTNEINRLLIPGMLLRRAAKGEIGLIPAARRLQDELLSPSGASLSADEGLDADLKTVAALKKVALMVLGTAMQTYGQKLTDEQEVLSAAADILIDIYAAESAVLRAREAVAGGRADAALHEAAARTFVNDATQRVQAAATNALAAMAEGDTLRTLLAALRRVLKATPVNTVALRRTLADATVARGSYIVS